MQSTSVAPRHVCYYPSPIQFQFQFHHVRLSQNAHKTLHKTHIASNILHSLTATNSCSKEREEKKNNNIKHPNQNQNQNRAYVEQFYSSIDTNNTINQTQNKDDEEEGTDSEDIFSNMWWADLKAALGQRINVEGLLGSVAVVSRERHLALPHVAVRDIRYIDWSELKRNGFQGVVFDKDNTITVPYSLDLWGPLGSSLERCKTVFGNNIAVFSNSAGLLEYDPDGSKARTLEGAIGIKVISHRVKKPAGTAEEIEGHFGCESSRLIMVGDRPFTDIVYGNRNNFLTILTEPLSLAEEPFIVQQVRELEVALVNRWSRQGVKPTAHRLLPDPLVCVRDPPPQ